MFFKSSPSGESRRFGIGGDDMINIITHPIPNPFPGKGSIKVSDYQRASKLQSCHIEIKLLFTR